MCVVTTVSFMFFLRVVGYSTHDREHCVREMCLSLFGAFDNDGVHVLLYLNGYVRLLIHFDLH